ncbi:MAG: Eco57I restriction-modification methylase domain-containing protein, partial [Halobacteriaceae archaeon]
MYAVDLNPMAVELAKVSLWINSAVEDKPLNFLDHHIKCGNSLIGSNSELLEGEFPVDAYETSSGRDWHVGNEIRKRVRSENKERSKGSSESSLQYWGASKEEYVDLAERLDAIQEEDTEDIEKKRDLYDELRESEAFQKEKISYDIWTAAFYWPMDGSAKEYPSPSTIEKIRRNPNPDDEALQDLINRAAKIAKDQKFFHWNLEFPEVFSQEGFDCIIGNPPWDSMEMREKEFFAVEAPDIAQASTASKRSKLINNLKDSNPQLYDKYERRKENIESRVKFVKNSGRFPLSSYGIVNTYAPFAEHSLKSLNNNGRSGLITPTAIATGSDTQDFFQFLIENRRLVSIYDFENVKGIFPEIDSRYRFCLLTLAGKDE